MDKGPKRVKNLSFILKMPQVIQTMGGDEVYIFAGNCKLCSRTTYTTTEGTPDPRGPAGEKHSCHRLDAVDYGMKGPSMNFCYYCAQDNAINAAKCVALAKATWTNDL